MFRFIASPIRPLANRDDIKNNAPTTRIAVPQFIYSTSDNIAKALSVKDLIFSDHSIIQEDEDERDIDLLDVLLQTHPSNKELEIDNFDGSVKTNGPYRDSFRYVLPRLPKYSQSLGQLQIRLGDWRELLKLLLLSSSPVSTVNLEPMFQKSSVLRGVLDAMTSCMCTDDRQNGGEQDGISWDAFDSVVSRSMV